MALDSIRGSLKEQGVRLTRQRQILLELIDKTGDHLDAERLYQLAKEKDPKLNRVTVYRTLKMLKAGGLVDELDLMHYGGDQHYYETRLKQEHAHVVCLRCGQRGRILRRRAAAPAQAGGGSFRFPDPAGADRGGRLLRPLPDAARARDSGGARSRIRSRRRAAARQPEIAARAGQARLMQSEAAASAVPSASLIVVDPNGHRSRVEVHPLPFLIGRQPDNQLIIRDSRASRNHSRIVLENGEYMIEDCGSLPRHSRQRQAGEAPDPAQLRPHRLRRGRLLPPDLRHRRRRIETPDGSVRGRREGARGSPAAASPSCARFWTWRAPCKARSPRRTC